MKYDFAVATITTFFMIAILSSRCSSAFVASKVPVSAAHSRRCRTTFQEHRMIGSILDMLGGGGGGKGGSGLIVPDKALPGREQKTPNIDGYKHYVLGNPLTDVPSGFDVAIYGTGCFWGSEKGQWRFPAGIYSTAVGYCGGYTKNPTYNEACSGMTGHTEGVRVLYNPKEVSFVDILRWFWESHDPCSGMGQGNDRGTQYRSAFYYHNDEQKQLIEASRDAYQQALTSAGINRVITTEIASASDYDPYGGLWFFAEQYHQQYLAKPGSRPYCSAQPQGVSLPPYDTWSPFPADSELYKKYQSTLPESFWKMHGPKRGCSVVQQRNDPILVESYA